ncbi:hypothetical protein [uncultured Deinococcus sp.]|uniref:hypothetical protein n=1 Tax=uncultured Deinococcus sp. TaxID=158789 RepID=UPI00258FEC8D|nr:hypothetical protein [uncultured Deinococcus sp.]
MNDTTHAPGTYTVFNALTYTRQELHVTGEGADVYAAASGVYPATFLRQATLEDVAAVLACPLTKVYAFTPAPVPTIGKARACRLHRLMGRLGLHEHYGLAARALGRDVFSLAALTEAEARAVWAFVVNLLPHARELAA